MEVITKQLQEKHSARNAIQEKLKQIQDIDSAIQNLNFKTDCLKKQLPQILDNNIVSKLNSDFSCEQVIEAKSLCNNIVNQLKTARNNCFDNKDTENISIKSLEKSNNEFRTNIENLSVQLGSLNNYNLIERKNKLKIMDQEINNCTKLKISDKDFEKKLKKYEKEFNQNQLSIQKKYDKINNE